MTARLDYQPELARAFHYGMLSSRASGALNEYLTTGELSEEATCVIHDAHSLVDEILSAQRMFGREGVATSPTRKAMDAFEVALRVIDSHQGDLDIKGVPEIFTLFALLDNTLEKLLQPIPEPKPEPQNVEKAMRFFRYLAGQMLAHLSGVPEPSPALF